MNKMFTTLTAFGVLAFGSVASAATVSYSLLESNALDPVYDTGTQIPWAVVTIADEIALDGDGNPIVLNGVAELTGNISFTVDVNEAAFDTVDATNFGLQAFSFNYNMTVLGSDPEVTLDASALAITNINPTDWIVTNTQGSISEFGKFDFDLAGDGKSRADPLTFLIGGVEGDTIDNYAVFFAGHIAGFDPTAGSGCVDAEGIAEDCTSAWFAGAGDSRRGLIPPVPVPASVWLFGSGLLGLVGVARRKNPTC